MKLKYIGESFGAVSLTNGRTYIATIGDSDYYRVFDDRGEDYMYPRENPSPVDGSSQGGRWEIVEDMDERERDLDERFKNMKDGEYNSLVDETIAICKEYAIKYKEEIEANLYL